MNYKIISINSHKTATALVAISAIAAVLVVSTVAIGSVRIALAQSETEAKTVTTHLNNTGINVQTNTNQKQDCDTAGGKSAIGGGDDEFHWGFGDDQHEGGSCTATSSHHVDQSGGILKKEQ